MKRKIYFPFIIATLGLFWNLNVQAEDFNRKAYVDSVVTVLQIHAEAIRNLALHDIKYSDNLVRHAVAIRRTFGLLGPMDWHADESVDHLMEKEAAAHGMNDFRFERLGKDSQKALKDLVRATHEHMEEHDRERVLEAVLAMQESCNACHAYLPSAVAPDVWGTLTRK